MCVVSNHYDYYYDKWKKYEPFEWPPHIEPLTPLTPYTPRKFVTQEDIDEFHKLLDRAREYDKKHNQPDCELEEKKEKLRKLAKELGIEITLGDD